MAHELPPRPEGMDIIAWIAQDMDCCVDKVINEYSLIFKDKKIMNLVVHVSKVGEIMNYVPKAVVCFRVGAGKEGPGPVDDVCKCLMNFRSLRIPTFYYTDDLIFGLNNWSPIKVLGFCDEVIVSSQPLVDFLKNSGCSKPIHIVETHMLIPEFDEANKDVSRLNPNKFKIFWSSGGRVGIRMLNLLLDRLEADPVKYGNVQVVMMAGGVAQVRSTLNHFRKVDKVFIDYMDKISYYSYAKACDVIVALGELGDLDYFLPQEFQRPWLDSKSAVKYCVAGLARKPIIAQSGMAMYDKAITHNVTGLKAVGIDQFMDSLDLLMANEDERKRLGEAARKDVEENYDIRKRADELLAILESKSVARPLDVVVKSIKKCWLPPVAGGPKSFHTMITKHLPKLSRGKWSIVSGDERLVDAAIIPAFLGANRIPLMRQANQAVRIISRVDGLPMNFDGSINYTNLEVMKIAMNQATTIVWQSKHCREKWTEFVDTTPGVIIHNGVDLEIYSNVGELHKFVGSQAHVLCVNFSTFQHKRVDLVQQVIAANPDTQFHIVGHYTDTNLDNEREVWAKYPNVEYLGPIYGNPSALAKMYRAATALLFTSEMEGSPNTVLEATACGCPIIYNARSNVVPEILGDLATGFLDPTKFKDAIYGLLDYGNRKVLRTKLEMRAEQYSAEVCVHKYLKLLETQTTDGMQLVREMSQEVMVG